MLQERRPRRDCFDGVENIMKLDRAEGGAPTMLLLLSYGGYWGEALSSM